LAIVLFGGGISARITDQSSQSASRQRAQLDPEVPESYLNLGETLGARAQSDEEKQYAAQVLTLGIGLAQRQGMPKLAASACIALAAIEDDAQMGTSLWDLALMLDPSRRSAWLAHRDARTQAQQHRRQAAARCLYAARMAHPKVASELLGQQGIRQTIHTIANRAGFDPAKIDQLLDGMIHDASEDECRGRVFITKRIDGGAKRIVCPDHQRPIGAGPDDQALRQLIKLELLLLGEPPKEMDARGWETAAYLGQQTPAIDPSVSMVIQHYQVDLTRPYWRVDRWSSSR